MKLTTNHESAQAFAHGSAHTSAQSSAQQSAHVGRHSVRIRPLRSDDGILLDQILAGMSPTSRYQRFFVPKPRLTSADRRHLTNVDERNHLAVVALTPDGAPVGVARVLRLPQDPGSAELSVAVVDAWQHRGVGEQLVSWLCARGRSVGLRQFVAMVLSDTKLVGAMRRRGWTVRERAGATTTLARTIPCFPQ